jgi:hypothetical protein
MYLFQRLALWFGVLRRYARQGDGLFQIERSI